MVDHGVRYQLQSVMVAGFTAAGTCRPSATSSPALEGNAG